MDELQHRILLDYNNDDDDYDLFIEYDDDDDDDDHICNAYDFSSRSDMSMPFQYDDNDDDSDENDDDPVLQWLNQSMTVSCSLNSCMQRRSSTLSTGAASTISSMSSSKNVRFSHIEVREYAITLGDHPSCSSAPALSLDWSYSHPKTQDISIDNDDNLDDSEDNDKNECNRLELSSNRDHKSLVIPQWRRIALLREVARMTNRDFEELGCLPVSIVDDAVNCSLTESGVRCAPPLFSKRRFATQQCANSNGLVRTSNGSNSGLSRSKSMQSELSACHTV